MPFKKQLDKKTEGKLRQFYRLLLSTPDFKQAVLISSYILEEKLHSKDNNIGLLESLNCAMIIAYCRPFSGNDKKSIIKIPDLPKSFITNLTDKEKELHEVIFFNRNTLLAHSDSEAANLIPKVLNINGKKSCYQLLTIEMLH